MRSSAPEREKRDRGGQKSERTRWESVTIVGKLPDRLARRTRLWTILSGKWTPSRRSIDWTSRLVTRPSLSESNSTKADRTSAFRHNQKEGQAPQSLSITNRLPYRIAFRAHRSSSALVCIFRLLNIVRVIISFVMAAKLFTTWSNGKIIFKN